MPHSGLRVTAEVPQDSGQDPGVDSHVHFRCLGGVPFVAPVRRAYQGLAFTSPDIFAAVPLGATAGLCYQLGGRKDRERPAGCTPGVLVRPGGTAQGLRHTSRCAKAGTPDC